MSMRDRRLRTPYLAAVAALGVLSIGCEPEPTLDTASPPPTAPLAAGFEIEIVDNAFEPSDVEVATAPAAVADEEVRPSPLRGDQTQVRFVNRGEVAHTVTFDDFGTGELPPGATVQFSFAGFEAGTYEYRCTIHPEMTGEVLVLE